MNAVKSMVVLISMVSSVVFAEEKIKINFINEEITKMIENYSKATGQKFIIDSTVRGKATVLSNDEATYEEAFNTLSEVLALNGYAIVKKDNAMIVRNARSAQRDGIEVSTELPKAKPERMATWIVNLKNVAAGDLKGQLGRLMNSSYGEIEANPKTNQLIITDWTSTLSRVADTLKVIDQPTGSKTEKIITKYEKERKERKLLEAKLLPAPSAKINEKDEPKEEKK